MSEWQDGFATGIRYREIMSKEIGELAFALSKFQGEVKDVTKNKVADMGNFKNGYADLPSILCEIRPLLCKNNLTISQLPSTQDNKVTVKSILMHKSGQWISCETAVEFEVGITKKGEKKSIAQAVGITISYIRRYAICAILGIGQVDTDGIVESDDAGYSSSIDTIEHLIKNYSISKEWIDKCLVAANVSSLKDLSEEQSLKMLSALEAKITKD